MRLTSGRIVHVNTSEGCRPSIVVAVFPNMAGEDRDGFNGVMFLDGSNDRDLGGAGDVLTRWVTSIAPGDGPHQYHDPRACPAEASTDD